MRDKLGTAFLIAGLAVGGDALAGEFTGSLGIEYTEGDYGGTLDTGIWAMSFVGQYEQGRWRLKASLPYLRITGPGSVIGPDGVPNPGVQADTRSTESGLGDLVLTGTYAAVYNAARGYGMDLVAKVKLPTADEDKGLGTGKTDVAIQVDPFMVVGRSTLFGTLGYKVYGDPEAIDYDNVWYGSVGVMGKLSAQTSIGVAHDVRQKLVPTGAAVSETTLFAVHKLDRDTRLQFYLVKGFSDASPELGGGVVLKQRF